jgi:hypothetical protein
MSKELALTLQERRWISSVSDDGARDASSGWDADTGVPSVVELAAAFMASGDRQWDELDDGSSPRAAVQRMAAQAYAERWHDQEKRFQVEHVRRRRGGDH